MEGSCYKVVPDTRVTWQEARDACAVDNASLVSIHTLAENSAVLLANIEANRTFWIGLHDPQVFESFLTLL